MLKLLRPAMCAQDPRMNANIIQVKRDTIVSFDSEELFGTRKPTRNQAKRFGFKYWKMFEGKR